MYADLEVMLLPSLDSAIDFSPMAVAPDTPLLDVITLMNECHKQASSVLVVENLQVVGWLTDRDIVRLLCSDVDMKTARISQVMATSVIALKRSDIQDITSVLSMLREHKLPLVSVINELGQLVGCITCESICQALNPFDYTKCLSDMIPPSPPLHGGEFVRYEVDVLTASNSVATIEFSQKPIKDETSLIMPLITEDTPEIFVERLNLFEQGQHSHEYRFLHKDSTYRPVHDQAKLVRDEAGKGVEIVGNLADITKRKQLEQELRRTLEKEKEVNELKSRLISMTSHEFRTQLSTILSSSELLQHYRHEWTEEKQITHLHRIQTAVKHMTDMLNDVLVIAKAEAGKLDFIPVPLDLVEYCRSLLEQAQLNVNNQHVIAFGSQSESMPCCMDEKLLEHILSNLLANAIKYSPTGSTVKFTLSCEQGRAIFEIQDQGIGIPPSDLPRLFESFYRATNVGNIQGRGLGLAIVKKCVDTHQGEIAVTTKVGVGTTFTVILPMVSG